MNSKVFTRFEPDPVGHMLGTRYNRFETALGVDGLAKEDHPDKIEILAVASREEGKGHFKLFIKLLKANYQTVCVWHIMNPVLNGLLEAWGFKPERTMNELGEPMTGWRWDKPPLNPTPQPVEFMASDKGAPVE